MRSQSLELALALDMADEARAIASQHYRAKSTFKNKSDVEFDPTTQADILIEEMMRRKIAQTFPNHAIQGEEMDNAPFNPSQPHWVLDPIDGTRNYFAGALYWGILIGFVENHKARLGIIDHPPTQERFIADHKKGFWRKGQREIALKTNHNKDLSQAILATTTPRLFNRDELTLFDEIASQAAITLYGGNCYFYGLLALGQIDIIIESNLKPYDVVALIPIIEAAGGIITNWQGGSALHGGQILACANHTLHHLMLDWLKPACLQNAV